MLDRLKTFFAEEAPRVDDEALIRRLADLVYVSHTDFIRSKHLALDAPSSD